ncbi:MAG: tRNA (adenosine(37)-N6)-threonylcarbamoyltransferase complex dimerization subunit type 1 TsaB, partial [Limnobacter sp.]|nr:tRNA (adenosine(37)-N6)-threonylcarbamoyltransferase complex dimerization subunit type 1 TsaB [Limnobacter sp.]
WMGIHQLNFESFAGLAVNIGPGGFTSLRTACGVAQGLSVAWHLPTFPVSSFDCLVEQALAEKVQLLGKGAVLIDARLNELYALRRHANHTDTADQPVLLPLQEVTVASWLAECHWLVCDEPAFHLIKNFEALPTTHVTHVSARALARVGWRELKRGRSHRAHDCQPLYVREKVAETTAERLARRHGTS